MTQPRSLGLLKGLYLQNCGPKAQRVLGELHVVDHTSCPHLAGAGMRILLELVVEDVAKAKGWTFKDQANLQQKVQKGLDEGVDPTKKDRRFTGVRKALSHPDHILAVNTFNGYIHNPNLYALSSDLENLTENYREFLSALNALVEPEKPVEPSESKPRFSTDPAGPAPRTRITHARMIPAKPGDYAPQRKKCGYCRGLVKGGFCSDCGREKPWP